MADFRLNELLEISRAELLKTQRPTKGSTYSGRKSRSRQQLSDRADSLGRILKRIQSCASCRVSRYRR